MFYMGIYGIYELIWKMSKGFMYIYICYMVYEWDDIKPYRYKWENNHIKTIYAQGYLWDINCSKYGSMVLILVYKQRLIIVTNNEVSKL